MLQHFAKVTARDGPDDFPHVHTGMIDLHGRRIDGADRFVVVIRNSLAASGIFFPRFDAALALYWEFARTEEAAPKLVKQWLNLGSAPSRTPSLRAWTNGGFRDRRSVH